MPDTENFTELEKKSMEHLLKLARREYTEAVIDHWQNQRNFKKIPMEKNISKNLEL